MRIGYLVPEFPAQTHIFFWREIQALKRIGAEVVLLSTRRPVQLSRHAFAAAAAAETYYLFPPPWVRAAFYLLARPLLCLRMLRYIAGVDATPFLAKLKLFGLTFSAADLLRFASAHRLEHVHGHSCAHVAHLLALASLSGRLPFSVTLHGDLPVYGTGHRAKFAQAQFVAVVTYALQKQVHSFCGMPIARLPLIRMGVDSERFRPAHARAATPGPLQLITVARLAACKGHIYALRAMYEARQRGAKLFYTIVGEGEHRAAIEAEVQRLGLTAEVRLVGTAGEDEVLAYLQAADVFVLPSVGLGEAAPVSVMEAMACGLPVVSSIIGGTAEMIIPEHDGFLFEQEDVRALARFLERLAADAELRRKMGEAARQTAEEQFTALGFARQFYMAIQQSAAARLGA